MRPLLIAMALGATGAFMLDPQQGRRRRALLRDRMVRGIREGREFRDAAAKDLRARAQGVAAQLRALRGGPVADDVLVARVRARLGRYVAHPRAILVTVRGGIATLTGDILAAEHPRLIGALRSVSGMADVEDHLDVHTSSQGVSALQGGAIVSGEPPELLQSRWAPGTRAVIGGAAALLALYGVLRGGIRGVAALAGGAALLARARANRPLQELMRRVPEKARGVEVKA